MTAPLARAAEAAAGDTSAQARADLARARERLAQRLEALEGSLSGLERVRALVRQRPGLMLGGAFLVGWGLSRLLRRR